MIPWELARGGRETGFEFREVAAGGREIRLANTRNYSMDSKSVSSNYIGIIRTGR